MSKINIFQNNDIVVITEKGPKIVWDVLQTKYDAEYVPKPFRIWLIKGETIDSLLKDKEINKYMQLNSGNELISQKQTSSSEDSYDFDNSLIKLLPWEEKLIEEYPKLTPQTYTMDQQIKLSEELNKAQRLQRKHFKSFVEDFKVGDRIIVNVNGYPHNAKIKAVDKRKISFQLVNLYGNVISETIHHAELINSKRYGWIWTQSYRYPNHINPEDIIKHGILKYDNGPEITSLDDIFLKWRTGGEDDNIPGPQIGKFATLDVGIYTEPYIIVDIEDDDDDAKVVTFKKISHNGPDVIKLKYDKGRIWYDLKGNKKNDYVFLGQWKRMSMIPT